MSKILFYSTNLNAKEVDVRTAILNGLAEDKGLYMPKSIPQFTKEELDSLKNMEYWEIAYTVMRKYLSSVIADNELKTLCIDAYNFHVPIQRVNDKMHIMWLTHGPTAAFKDFAARAMARLMQYFISQKDEKLLILTATSGDTGSAVANAFYGLDSIKVVVLFPEKEVTERQRKLMTTLGKNITAISVDGKFDDCQALVKEAFVDPDMKRLELSSANSINFARLMPQIVYYVYAYSRFGKVNFSVPSGNFGDLLGGLLAKKMGIPIGKFIVAVNENDEFVTFFNTGKYDKISPSKNCISNAMNVGHPSNFARLVALYGGIIDEKGCMKQMPDMDAIKKDMCAYSVTDKETREEIKSIYERYTIVVEPHGAVALHAYEKYVSENKDTLNGISLETADPAKFPEVVQEVISIDPKLPACLKEVMAKKEAMEHMENDYPEFKKFLLKNFS